MNEPEKVTIHVHYLILGCGAAIALMWCVARERWDEAWGPGAVLMLCARWAVRRGAGSAP